MNFGLSWASALETDILAFTGELLANNSFSVLTSRSEQGNKGLNA